MMTDVSTPNNKPATHAAGLSNPDAAPASTVRARVNEWFLSNGRDLPWRRPEATAWGVLVSEIMLQQTPVMRVQPVWEEWMERWPTPHDLAAEPAGEVLRAWGRLGYPRRALRLHACAHAIATEHDGVVPNDLPTLLSLPGVGEYTAAAVACFAYRIPATVVDTNIRRVIGRIFHAKALPGPTMTRAQYRAAQALMPAHPNEAGDAADAHYSPAEVAEANTWNAASMELGALVCTARDARCGECPVESVCGWVAAGKPAADYVPRGQAWHGTDRQVRGRVMAVLRESDGPVPYEMMATRDGADRAASAATESRLRSALAELALLTADDAQRASCVRGLVEDGLAVLTSGGEVSLPG